MHKSHQTDIPLLFFFVAFFIIILGLFSKLSFQKGTPIQHSAQTAQTVQNLDKKNAKAMKLNFNNPLLCILSSTDSTISAQLDGTSAALTIQQSKSTQKMVVQADCVYSWGETERVGKKQCGVGQYITVVKQLLGSGLASVDSLTALMKQSGKNTSFDVARLMESCKNVKKIEKEVFVMPNNVAFK